MLTVMNPQRGWYDDLDPSYVRYWDGTRWTERRANYPAMQGSGPISAVSQPVRRARVKALPALVIAGFFALNDIAALPLGSSPLNETAPWLIAVAIAIPFGTIAAVGLLLYVRSLRLQWARSAAIIIGIFLVFSFPLGVFVSSVLSPLWQAS
jgi:hypothetical protein